MSIIYIYNVMINNKRTDSDRQIDKRTDRQVTDRKREIQI